MLFSAEQLRTPRATQAYSFTIEQPQIVGLMGINGAGKSSLLRLIGGAHDQYLGQATLGRHTLLTHPADYRRHIGFMVDQLPYTNRQTPKQYLQLIAAAKQIENSAAVIEATLAAFDLTQLSQQLIRTLSLGQRQRLNLAQALLNSPSLVLLDEPLNGLDPNQQDRFWQMLKEQPNQRAIIIASHHINELVSHCDRIMIIDQQQIVFDCEYTSTSYLALTKEPVNESEHWQVLHPQIALANSATAFASLNQACYLCEPVDKALPGIFKLMADGDWQWS
ncbi:MAG: ABC transporter ATP-binding protein [Gammaproteobacteria bacterium]|nr:ABC transporter ATP-binding protein [Gammaproteobacteria bacterium]NVK89482.1 ABC transporter ATP-binding protein [Gammaproteobacteria bacterium]